MFSLSSFNICDKLGEPKLSILTWSAFDRTFDPAHTFLSVWSVRRSSWEERKRKRGCWNPAVDPTICEEMRNNNSKQIRLQSDPRHPVWDTRTGSLANLPLQVCFGLSCPELGVSSVFNRTPQFSFKSSRRIRSSDRFREGTMEILDSTEPFLHWDRNLSELSDTEEIDSMLYTNVSYRSVMDPGGRGRY